MRGHTKNWSDKDTETLLALYNDGITIIQICAQMGFHRETVRIWLSKLGLRKPRKTPKVVDHSWDAEAIELYKSGVNCEQIGKRLGKDSSTVRFRLRAAGVWQPVNKKYAKYESQKYRSPENEAREDLPLRPCRGVICRGKEKFKPESRYVFRCLRCREAVKGMAHI